MDLIFWAAVIFALAIGGAVGLWVPRGEKPTVTPKTCTLRVKQGEKKRWRWFLYVNSHIVAQSGVYGWTTCAEAEHEARMVAADAYHIVAMKVEPVEEKSE